MRPIPTYLPRLAAAATRCFLTLLLSLAAAATAAAETPKASQTEQANVAAWRQQRLQELTNETGWLNLVGLYWLNEGPNTFGRDPSNTLVLNHPNLAPTAGTFALTNDHVTFTTDPDAAHSDHKITRGGQPVTTIDLVSDAKESPTVISSGPLRFFIIERAGKVGVRVRDVDSPLLKNFQGLKYFPISNDWVLTARFEPYNPQRHITIVNILGLEEEMVAPGALVFTTKEGQEVKLDAVLDGADATDLFVMYSDATSGHETYGAGRFLHVPFAIDGKTVIDFNKSYNPPCAFSNFATCPLPPYQNRLKLKITAGELKYEGSH